MNKKRKIGRNDPCPCGSGLKYKRCCLLKNKIKIPSVSEKFLVGEDRSQVIDFKPLGHSIPGRPIIQAEFKGQRVRAVWNRLYFRPITETFHEFILNVLKWTLGRRWYMNEVGKPAEERHQIVKWFFSYGDFSKKMSTNDHKVTGGWKAIPSGDVQALLTLAHDIYSLQHTNFLPRFLVERIRDPFAFQGARYEIIVSAIFARAAFQIEFLKEKTKKHPEFIAEHSQSGDRIAVEAKSRHRKGVLHYPGKLDSNKVLRGDVDRLFKKALAQNSGDIPFMIFIDINAPLTANIDFPDKPWFRDLKNMIYKYGKPTPENPDPFNAIFVTNYAYYYGGLETKTPSGETLSIISKYPKYSLANSFILNDIYNAVKNYGKVPLGP